MIASARGNRTSVRAAPAPILDLRAAGTDSSGRALAQAADAGELYRPAPTSLSGSTKAMSTSVPRASTSCGTSGATSAPSEVGPGLARTAAHPPPTVESEDGVV